MSVKFTKLPAFTLTELLVALAISTIVIGLGYSVLTLFNKSFLGIQNNYDTATKHSLLEQQLIIDFNRYRKKEYQANTNVLKLSTPIDSLFYDFNESLIIRKHDTLLSQEFTKQFFLKGIEVSSGTIDAVKLTLGKDEVATLIFISHALDAQQKITLNGD